MSETFEEVLRSTEMRYVALIEKVCKYTIVNHQRIYTPEWDIYVDDVIEEEKRKIIEEVQKIINEFTHCGGKENKNLTTEIDSNVDVWNKDIYFKEGSNNNKNAIMTEWTHYAEQHLRSFIKSWNKAIQVYIKKRINKIVVSMHNLKDDLINMIQNKQLLSLDEKDIDKIHMSIIEKGFSFAYVSDKSDITKSVEDHDNMVNLHNVFGFNGINNEDKCGVNDEDEYGVNGEMSEKTVQECVSEESIGDEEESEGEISTKTDKIYDDIINNLDYGFVSDNSSNMSDNVVNVEVTNVYSDNTNENVESKSDGENEIISKGESKTDENDINNENVVESKSGDINEVRKKGMCNIISYLKSKIDEDTDKVHIYENKINKTDEIDYNRSIRESILKELLGEPENNSSSNNCKPNITVDVKGKSVIRDYNPDKEDIKHVDNDEEDEYTEEMYNEYLRKRRCSTLQDDYLYAEPDCDTCANKPIDNLDENICVKAIDKLDVVRINETTVEKINEVIITESKSYDETSEENEYTEEMYNEYLRQRRYNTLQPDYLYAVSDGDKYDNKPRDILDENLHVIFADKVDHVCVKEVSVRNECEPDNICVDSSDNSEDEYTEEMYNEYLRKRKYYTLQNEHLYVKSDGCEYENKLRDTLVENIYLKTVDKLEHIHVKEALTCNNDDNNSSNDNNSEDEYTEEMYNEYLKRRAYSTLQGDNLYAEPDECSNVNKSADQIIDDIFIKASDKLDCVSVKEVKVEEVCEDELNICNNSEDEYTEEMYNEYLKRRAYNTLQGENLYVKPDEYSYVNKLKDNLIENISIKAVDKLDHISMKEIYEDKLNVYNDGDNSKNDGDTSEDEYTEEMYNEYLKRRAYNTLQGDNLYTEPDECSNVNRSADQLVENIFIKTIDKLDYINVKATEVVTYEDKFDVDDISDTSDNNEEYTEEMYNEYLRRRRYNTLQDEYSHVEQDLEGCVNKTVDTLCENIHVKAIDYVHNPIVEKKSDTANVNTHINNDVEVKMVTDFDSNTNRNGEMNIPDMTIHEEIPITNNNSAPNNIDVNSLNMIDVIDKYTENSINENYDLYNKTGNDIIKCINIMHNNLIIYKDRRKYDDMVESVSFIVNYMYKNIKKSI